MQEKENMEMIRKNYDEAPEKEWERESRLWFAGADRASMTLTNEQHVSLG